MDGKDTPDHVFIDSGAERLINLLRDPWTAEPWVALL
jgi:hypothetical protein